MIYNIKHNHLDGLCKLRWETSWAWMARGNDEMKTTSNYLISDKYLYFLLHEICPKIHGISKLTKCTKTSVKYWRKWEKRYKRNNKGSLSRRQFLKAETRQGERTNISKITNIIKWIQRKKNQGSERHKNNNCLRRTREGDPTNITKITNTAKISNEARDSSSEKCYFRYFSYISEAPLPACYICQICFFAIFAIISLSFIWYTISFGSVPSLLSL